ncbi:hypothetical protein IGI96_001733 [Enterococcus sp. DIV0421]|uniref:hypothetical protein n=1 Tax=Enterococcus sp. DIV0421 TaxID=2774688 RepID=UPI003F27A322
MSEIQYYRVATAIQMISPSLSSRTFYDWLNRIEQVTDYRFLRRERVFSGKVINQVLLTKTDVERLTRLYHYRVNLEEDLTLSIYRVFSPEKYSEIKSLDHLIL